MTLRARLRDRKPDCGRKMDSHIYWHRPFDLVDGSNENLIFTIDDLDGIPGAPGIYIFARQHGQAVSPLYIGQARSLRARIEQQLRTNVRLMRGIETAPAGYRILLVGELITKRGQRLSKALNTIESTFIRYFLAEGCSLLNVNGTRTPVDRISFEGSRIAKNLFPPKEMAFVRA